MNRAWITPQTAQFFETTRPERKRFSLSHSYYHDDDLRFFQSCLRPDSVALLIGSDVLDLAARLKAAAIYVCELDAGQSAGELPPHVRVVPPNGPLPLGVPFDAVLLPYTLQIVNDIQVLLEDLKAVVTPDTRLISLHYNFLWSPVIRLAQRLSLKSPTPDLNWLNERDVRNLFHITGFQAITSSARCLMPFEIPWVSDFINTYLAPLPIFQWCCLKSFAIEKPAGGPAGDFSVSILVPVRNEAGNIAPLLDRLPKLGTFCEVIFVEGHSTDNSWEEIQKQIATHPRKDAFKFQAMRQTGKGKADAVRTGFARATGDVLLILDADLSVQPEDLPHFTNAIRSGAAEFLNGSRLVYDMEQHAMQVLNLFFNKVFALLLSWFIGQPVKDTLCGTKVLRRRDYERIRKYLSWLDPLDPFGDFELLFGASRLSLKIADIPIRYKERRYGRTNIQRFRNGWELLKMILLCWDKMK